MYHRGRYKMTRLVLVLVLLHAVTAKNIVTTSNPIKEQTDDSFDNNIIDFEQDYSVKHLNSKYDKFDKETHRYTIVRDNVNTIRSDVNKVTFTKANDTQFRTDDRARKVVEETTPAVDFSVLPIELLSTTDNSPTVDTYSTLDQDLTVIPLSTKKQLEAEIKEQQQPVTLPLTKSPESTTEFFTTIENDDKITSNSEDNEATTTKREISTTIETTTDEFSTTEANNVTTTVKSAIINIEERNVTDQNTTKIDDTKKANTTKKEDEKILDFDSSEYGVEVPVFTELDTEDSDVPEDYYDTKDVIPTTAPKTDALSVIFGLAGSMVESVVESVAERVVPKGIYDLFKRMQKQNEALEAERLRSREENGGLGQFTRGILKTISSGLSKPLSQLMAGAQDKGALDSDRGFLSGVASGVSNVASSVSDAFKDRVQAIYPGTVWCGDGHSASARSSDLGLFFFTDTCCRQHDACKIYIKAGDTKYGLTNTGLFTRSHCSCDAEFLSCLRRTSSLVSGQIGLTYFNVLSPQCFRRAHPIVRCVRRTRITGQKCEEYELDYSKPKMWQWFDNETF